MELTAAFPTVSQGVKQDGDPFTFKDEGMRTDWKAIYTRHLGRSRGDTESPVVQYHLDSLRCRDFAAAIAANVEKLPRKDFTNLEEAVRNAYVAQVFLDTTKTPVAPAKVSDLLGGWIHADAAERALNPTAVHDREVAALLKAEGRAPV